jgi:hypothetical protein
MDGAELQAEILALRRRIRFLLAIVRLAFLLVRLSGFHLDSQRVPQGETKRSILAAIASAQKAIPLAVALRVLRLPPARFHAWRSLADNCTLDDRSSCPHTTPAQLTAEEIATIGSMVRDASFRHMSLRALALHALRIGRVFAAVSTWARLVREHGWLRPRRPLYPAKPREGIRAWRPNEYWHIDVSAPCVPAGFPCRARWLSTDGYAVSNEGRNHRKGAVNPCRIPPARLHEQSGLK